MRLIVILLLVAVWLPAKSDKGTLRLLHADFNSNRIIDGSILTNLYGDVRFKYGKLYIKSDTTIWKRGEGILLVKGNVLVTRPNQKLTCDSLTFFSNSRYFELRGHTVMVDTAHEVTVNAKEGDYYLKVDSLELRGDPIVYFWSSEDSDTVTLTGEPMHYLRPTGTARVVKNLTIAGRGLDVVAGNGYYCEEVEKARVKDSVTVNYNLSTIKGDDIWILFSHQQADSFTVVGGDPTGITKDTIGEDTTLNIITGDSLHFTLDTNRIKRIVSVGNAKMEQFSLLNKLNSDILFGDRVETNLYRGGGGDANAYERVRSLYRSDEEIYNEVSSDSMYLKFDTKGVTEISLTGGVQGVILPK